MNRTSGSRLQATPGSPPPTRPFPTASAWNCNRPPSRNRSFSATNPGSTGSSTASTPSSAMAASTGSGTKAPPRTCWTRSAPDDYRRRDIWGVVLCYAESEDGLTWRKPELGLQEWNGSRANNIVLGRELTASRGLIGAAVFRDDTAPAHERFKCMFMGQDRKRLLASHGLPRLQAHPLTRWRGLHVGHSAPSIAATSPDGLRLDDPRTADCLARRRHGERG